MTDNRERQVLRAEDMQRASTAMMKFGVEAVKKNPVKVYSCRVYSILITGNAGYRVLTLFFRLVHTLRVYSFVCFSTVI